VCIGVFKRPSVYGHSMDGCVNIIIIIIIIIIINIFNVAKIMLIIAKTTGVQRVVTNGDIVTYDSCDSVT